jgi:hypothetical protein
MISLCRSQTDGAPTTTGVNCWPFFPAAYKDRRPVKLVWGLHRTLSLWRKCHTETIRLPMFSLGTFGWTALILTLYRCLLDGRTFCSVSHQVPDWRWSWEICFCVLLFLRKTIFQTRIFTVLQPEIGSSAGRPGRAQVIYNLSSFADFLLCIFIGI